MTDDSVTYSYLSQNYADSTWTTAVEFSMSINLSNPINASDVLSDINTLLDEWDLTNDITYPWRNDGTTSLAPLVIRNEVPQNVSPLDFTVFSCTATQVNDCFGDTPDMAPDYVPTYGQVINVDANAALYDGTIIGSPLPAGYQGYFDFYAQDWQSCVEDDGHTILGYQMGWGQFNNTALGLSIPLSATHWTSNQMVWGLPPGAWIFYNLNPSWVSCGEANFASAPTLIAQKWAETKMGFASQNFFRPAGADRFIYDEENVYAIETITGTGTGATVTLQTCDECSNPGLSSAPGLWGGPAVGGFYEIASISGGNVLTIGSLVYNIPSDWSSASGDDAYCFGKLRWSTGSGDPPAILGRVGVSSVAAYMGGGSVSELTTDTLTTLGMNPTTADNIDIYDINMNLLSGNQPVTRIDDTHFTVPISHTTIGAAAWIMAHGAPAYYWNDTLTKGDYVYTDWTWWPRLICEAERWNSFVASCPPDGLLDCTCPSGTYDVYCNPFYDPIAGNFDDAFTQTAGCIPFNPCNPSVLCISPNGESFTNGVTYGFKTIYLDEIYGSGWQAEFQQVMTDLLYQTPHYPASNPCTPTPFQWLADTGGCYPGDSDTQEYYAHPPLVEARLTLPANGGPSSDLTAPSLPSGIVIGWASPAGIDSDCGSPPANTLFPPGSNGYGLSSIGAWEVWSGMCQCINSSGQFADQYENTVVGCQ